MHSLHSLVRFLVMDISVRLRQNMGQSSRDTEPENCGKWRLGSGQSGVLSEYQRNRKILDPEDVPGICPRSAPVNGMSTLGIAVAGGSGNGLVSGLRPLHHFFQIMQVRAIELLPSTRLDFDAALQCAGTLGERIADMAGAGVAFDSAEQETP
jgi:hypothetical protein